MKSKPLYSLFLLCILIAQKNVTAHILTSHNVFSSVVSIDTCLVDTSQANFQAGVLNNVELTSSPGDVKLAGRSEASDQVSNPAALSTTNNLSATVWTGQTFRAGVTGGLTRITVGLGLASGTSGTITVEIRNLNGINPGTTVLATSTIGPVTNVGSAALYTTTFTTPAAVVSGTSYSILLRTSVGSTVFGVRGSTAGGSTLANGQVFTTNNSGTTWTAVAADLYFTTYVTPLLTSAASGNLVSGVKDANPAIGFIPVWTTLSWTATTPASTAVQFQVAASNNASGPFNFTGPDGTAATFFTTSGAALSRFNGFRYLKYTAFLDAGINATTPVLQDVTACLNYVTLLSATIASSSNVSCNGGSNGSATVNASGGTPGYSYSWSPAGGTAATASGLVAGAYTVTVTDANLFTQTATVTVTEPPVLAAANSDLTNVSCNGSSNGSATVSVSGGTPGYTYSWAPSGGTAATASGLAAGTYTVTVTDANGCTAASNYTITEPPAINTSSGSLTNVTCNGGSNGTASVSPSGGTPGYTYSWAPSGGTAATASGLAAGTYTVTVTDANGCTAARNYTITEPPAINTSSGSLTNVTCNGGSNGAASVSPSGGTPGYSYSWAPSGGTAATASGLAAGTYTVTVTDANGCTAARNYTITEPPAINTSSGSLTNVTCNGGSNGTASVSPSGGTPGYSYSWAPSGGTAATASGLAAGTYTVTVTDANGCTAARNYTITEPPAINTSSGSLTNVTCNGGSNGTATVSPSGGTPGYSYSWAPSGGTAATASGLGAGTYTVTVTDANGCTAARNYTITEPPAINTSSGSQTNVTCNGGSNGAASVSPSGGTPGYTYSWAPSGGAVATASGLAAGTYTVTVTDANGCTTARNYTITEPPAITATTSQTNAGCNGTNTGSASVIASGGTGGYTYSWSPSGGTGATASDLAAGDYTCTITDANSCSITKDFTLTEFPAITATTSQTNVTCTGGSTGIATVVASGGTGAKTYLWSPSGGTDATAVDLAAGSYTCTITDENLCSITKIFIITEPASTPGSNSYLLPTSNQTVSNTAGSSNFVNGSCELVSTVVPSGTSPVSGMVTSEVWIEATVPTESGAPFVQRHYEITPATNTADATGTVTLYFTQAEFDNFNAHAGSTLNLPADASDDAGKANLRIGKYSGISGDGTGLPASYNGSRTVIDPDNNNIVWNAVSGTWEVTFSVDGFSGFIIQTNASVLPIKWASFTVTKQGQSVLLNWSTATEQNTKDFVVQYSIDGIKWNNIANLAAAGNSSSQHYYTYLHNNTVKGYNYYRIMQTDIDGKINYSEMRVIKLSGDYAPFTLLGNPVSNGILQLEVHQAAALSLYEINGKLLWVRQFGTGLQNIDVSRYAKGIYLLKTKGKTQKIFVE